jgi:acetylornithine deacetylase/succinyl-diaminopimelate desuccinylase-like protein
LGQVAAFIKEMLSSWGVPFITQEFALRPHAMLLWGVGSVLLAAIFVILILKKKPLWAFIPLLLLPAFIFAEAEFSKPVLSWLIQKPAENIVIEFKSNAPVRELIFAAHYDSKTDFWDHLERARIASLFRPSLFLGLALIIWTLLTKKVKILSAKKFQVATIIGSVAFLVIYGLAFSWWGGYIFMSQKSDSLGAVDDGASVVILLALAKDIQDSRVNIGSSDVTILLTAGEEVGLQGADHFVKKRFGSGRLNDRPSPYLVNMELAGQNGNMVYWEKTGTILRFYEADAGLVKRLNVTWKEMTGKDMDSYPTIGDDSKMFAEAGVPVVTVGNSGLPGLGRGGFHSVDDNLERIDPENLELMRETLARFIESY